MSYSTFQIEPTLIAVNNVAISSRFEERKISEKAGICSLATFLSIRSCQIRPFTNFRKCMIFLKQIDVLNLRLACFKDFRLDGLRQHVLRNAGLPYKHLSNAKKPNCNLLWLLNEHKL